MSIKLNFTYVVREPSDGQFGVVRGGQWNGLIRSWSDMWKNRKCHKYENVNARQVIDKEVMLGAAAFTVSRERSQVQAYCLSPFAFAFAFAFAFGFTFVPLPLSFSFTKVKAVFLLDGEKHLFLGQEDYCPTIQGLSFVKTRHLYCRIYI